ncbi:hypothetical protein AMQ83_35080 [Paenibacillus riograndensis]|nr:hypothetical protein AMQ83_35080 [Paenibacillus riograndensis]
MFGYTSLGYDYYSGYAHAQARDFDSSIGRFISEDTYEGQLIDPLSLNLYAYVKNNPLRYTDPSGNKPWEPYDVNELRLLLNDAIAKNLNKGSKLYQAYHDKIWERYGFASFLKTNRYNYLFGLLTGTSAYKNSAGNASWAREELIREFFGANLSGYIASMAMEGSTHVSTVKIKSPTVTDSEAVVTKGTGKVRTFTSTDKYVGETANAIEARYPGKVVDVNKKVYRQDGTPLTDYDIELDNAIIQVKQGGGKGATRQAINTATSTSKEVVVYLPDQSPNSAVVKGLQKEGFRVFTNQEELINYVGR